MMIRVTINLERDGCLSRRMHWSFARILQFAVLSFWLVFGLGVPRG